jgi:hypothetical protein
MEKNKIELNNTKPSPSELARWWQEAENHIRLAHPHESLEKIRKLTEKYVRSQLKKYQEEHGVYEKPEISEKDIAEWYNEERIRIRERYPDMPLKEREKLASEVIAAKIKIFQRTIPLDEFLKKQEEKGD